MLFALNNGNDVYSTKLTAVLGIGLRFKRDFLPFLQSAEALHLNLRVMHEDVLTALVIGNKSVTFSVAEPLNCSIHNIYLLGAEQSKLL